MLRPDPHVTVRLMRLRDDRFPGWEFEIIRAGDDRFRAHATRDGVSHESRLQPTAFAALEQVRERVRDWNTAALARDAGIEQ